MRQTRLMSAPTAESVTEGTAAVALAARPMLPRWFYWAQVWAIRRRYSGVDAAPPPLPVGGS